MRKFAIILALGAFSSAAWGQAGELWVSGGGSLFQNSGLGTDLAFSNSSNDIKLDDGWRISFRFNFNVGDHYGAEVGYAYNHTDLNFNPAASAVILAGSGVATVASPTSSISLGMHMHQGTVDGVYYPFTTDKAKVRPFLVGGVQFDNFVPPGGQSYNGSTKFGANFGGGVKVHVKGMWAVRFDAREYVTGKPSFGFANNSGALWQSEISAGVGIGF
jgi:outer membrane protein with beta-barrel domain